MDAYAASATLSEPANYATDRIASRIRSAIDRIEDLNVGVGSVGDRLFGAEPLSGSGPQAVPPQPTGELAQIEALLDTLHERISRAADLTSRFHRL